MFSNPIVKAISQILGILSAVIGIWGYIETRQSAQITYNITHETIFRPSKALPGALALPSGKNISNARVIQSVLTIWNGGNVAFKGDETRQKLTVSGDSSVEILECDAVVSKVLPGSSGFTVKSDPKSIVIDWRNFDPGEGLQIVMLSTGEVSSIDLSGRFAPGQKIVRGPIKSVVGTLATIFVFLSGAFLLVSLIGGAFPALKRVVPQPLIRTAIAFVLSLFVLFVYAAVSFKILYYSRSFVGDVSPIDPYLTYIEVNPKLDYRSVPM